MFRRPKASVISTLADSFVVKIRRRALVYDLSDKYDEERELSDEEWVWFLAFASEKLPEQLEETVMFLFEDFKKDYILKRKRDEEYAEMLKKENEYRSELEQKIAALEAEGVQQEEVDGLLTKAKAIIQTMKKQRTK
jgi:hypothetical protein